MWSINHNNHSSSSSNTAGYKRPRAGSAKGARQSLKKRIVRQKPTADNQRSQILALERSVKRLSGRVADTFTSMPHTFSIDQYLQGTSYVYHLNDPITLYPLWQSAPGGLVATESARLASITVKGQVDASNNHWNESFHNFFVKLKEESKIPFPKGYIDGPLIENRDYVKHGPHWYLNTDTFDIITQRSFRVGTKEVGAQTATISLDMDTDGEPDQHFSGLAGTNQDYPSSNHKEFNVKIACNIEYNNPNKRWNQLSDDTMPRKDHRYMLPNVCFLELRRIDLGPCSAHSTIQSLHQANARVRKCTCECKGSKRWFK